jgi:hypothetical protein
LAVASDVVGAHVDDAALVNVSRCDVTGGDEIPEPLGGIRIVFVVVGTHLAPHNSASPKITSDTHTGKARVARKPAPRMMARKASSVRFIAASSFGRFKIPLS